MNINNQLNKLREEKLDPFKIVREQINNDIHRIITSYEFNAKRVIQDRIKARQIVAQELLTKVTNPIIKGVLMGIINGSES